MRRCEANIKTNLREIWFKMWNRLICLRIGSTGGPLRTRVSYKVGNFLTS
jgi:hypothetical protein